MAAQLRYVALGDSYTIGTAVDAAEGWPMQLAGRVSRLDLVANLAVDGRTSHDVLERQVPAALDLQPGFVSLLVGVNDVVQGVADAAYRWNVDAMLDALLDRLAPDRVLCVETPDYTRTPAGADYGDPPIRRAGILRANAILAGAAAARGVPIVDGILAISLGVTTDPALVAPDGLHPSGLQYRRWVDERIAPVVEALLAGD